MAAENKESFGCNVSAKNVQAGDIVAEEDSLSFERGSSARTTRMCQSCWRLWEVIDVNLIIDILESCICHQILPCSVYSWNREEFESVQLSHWYGKTWTFQVFNAFAIWAFEADNWWKVTIIIILFKCIVCFICRRSRPTRWWSDEIQDSVHGQAENSSQHCQVHRCRWRWQQFRW